VGIGGVTVELYDAAGVLVDTVLTQPDGSYLFTNVAFADDYTIQISNLDPALVGFTPTVGPQSPGGYVSAPVSLTTTSSVVTDIDFGFDNPVLNTISDAVWTDLNGDGVRDPAEPGIADVQVVLYSDGDNNGTPDDIDGDGQPDVLAVLESDSNGEFSFTGLTAGT
jgi:hypothetical protein